MSRRRYSQTRIKIDSPDLDMIEKIIDTLSDAFMCLPGPVRESTSGGFHVFISVEVRE